jgi:hypothetical protein
MSKKINELRQKINELEAALQKDNLSEQTREAISQRLFDVKTQLAMWQNSNKGDS